MGAGFASWDDNTILRCQEMITILHIDVQYLPTPLFGDRVNQ